MALWEFNLLTYRPECTLELLMWISRGRGQPDMEGVEGVCESTSYHSTRHRLAFGRLCPRNATMCPQDLMSIQYSNVQCRSVFMYVSNRSARWIVLSESFNLLHVGFVASFPTWVAVLRTWMHWVTLIDSNYAYGTLPSSNLKPIAPAKFGSVYTAMDMTINNCNKWENNVKLKRTDNHKQLTPGDG